MENKKELIKEMVKLQILGIRWVERNTNLRIAAHADIRRFLTGNKLTLTYGEAIEILKNNILKYCEHKELQEQVNSLNIKIKNSDLASLRFGLEPQKKFTDEEQELDTYKLQRLFFMLNEMVDLAYIEEKLGVKVSTVKQAAQQERLLNTKKVGRSWLVHIPECRAYWGIPAEDGLYKDWVY